LKENESFKQKVAKVEYDDVRKVVGDDKRDYEEIKDQLTCRFCETMLAPGKIFDHETKCD
jgi:hypothetical protein